MLTFWKGRANERRSHLPKQPISLQGSLVLAATWAWPGQVRHQLFRLGIYHWPKDMAENESLWAGSDDKPHRSRARRPMEAVQCDGTFVGPGICARFETAPSVTLGILEGGC